MATKNTDDGKTDATAKKPRDRRSVKPPISDIPGDSASKRALFVKLYIANGFNAKRAAIDAGYSEKTATSQGSRLLTFVDVKEALRSRLEV